MIRPMRVDPGGARDAARQILGRREFQPERAPKPLAGPVRWIGDRLNGIADWLGTAIGDVFDWIFKQGPDLARPLFVLKGSQNINGGFS